MGAGQRGREHLGLPEEALLPPAFLEWCWWTPGQGDGAWLEQRGRGEHHN